MLLISSRNFDNEVEKLTQKFKIILKDKLALFKVEPYNKIFNNHKLKGSLKTYRSINITGDYRVIYEQLNHETVRLIRIGSHSELYGK